MPRRAEVSLAAECFSELARGHAAEADIVITDHAMLAINAFEGVAVLPDYDVVVIDEAHELQDRVTSAVAGQLSAAMVRTAASTARKHTGISVEPLDSAAGALEMSWSRCRAVCWPPACAEEQELVLVQLREAARAALSDSSPRDPGRRTAGGSWPAPGSLRCSRWLNGCCPRRIRARSFGQPVPARTARPVTTPPTTTNRRRSTSLRCPLHPAARRAVRRHTVVLTSATLSVENFGRRCRFARIAGAVSGVFKRRCRSAPSITPAKACCTWHRICPSRAGHQHRAARRTRGAAAGLTRRYPRIVLLAPGGRRSCSGNAQAPPT